jgi:hypothetical protein
MKIHNKILSLASIALIFASCEPEFENELSESYSAGDANFTTYVAVGNSLTAGFMDGTVSKGSQANSFPSILASQFAFVGGGAFTQPSYADDVNNLGGLLLNGTPIQATRRIIDLSQGGVESIAGSPTIEVSTLQAKAYNNMGVPGAKSFHLLAPGYGNVAGVLAGTANPYFVRHATTPNATVLGDAMTLNPTFFTNWIGANDVLAYATSGGVGVSHNDTGNLNPATYGGNDITNNNVFANVYSTIINTLTANGAKGVVATVPNVTSIPYFTTVPFKPLPAEATSSNATALGLYNFLAAVTGGRIAPLSTTPGTRNPVLIIDETLTDLGATISGAAAGVPSLAPFASSLGALYGKARHATANDLIVLEAGGIIGQPNPMGTAPFNVNGVTLPLADRWVLTADEISKINTATTSYNAAIVSIAASKNLAVADMNAILGQLVSGIRTENNSFYTAYYFGRNPLNLGANAISPSLTEGSVLFSLDGVHPNARGYAVISNEIIKVINAKYNSRLPLVDATRFPGINILPNN